MKEIQMKAFHTISFSSVVLVGGAMLASLAFAADPKSAKPDAEFMTMDANKDGKISADEHATASKKKIGRASCRERVSPRV